MAFTLELFGDIIKIKNERKKAMKICENCETYQVMPVPDKTKESFRAVIAPQSDSDECRRFVWVYPTNKGTLCYYCQKKSDKRIANLNQYGNAYE